MPDSTFLKDLPDLKSAEGKGTFGCLVFIVLVGIAIVVVINAGPPYYAYRSFEADVKTEISRAGAKIQSTEVLRDNILELAKKNEVVLSPEQVNVQRYSTQLKVSIQYSVPVDFYLYQHTMIFNITASSYVGTL